MRMPDASPAAKFAYTSGAVALAVYAVGLIASFWLPRAAGRRYGRLARVGSRLFHAASASSLAAQPDVDPRREDFARCQHAEAGVGAALGQFVRVRHAGVRLDADRLPMRRIVNDALAALFVERHFQRAADSQSRSSGSSPAGHERQIREHVIQLRLGEFHPVRQAVRARGGQLGPRWAASSIAPNNSRPAP